MHTHFQMADQVEIWIQNSVWLVVLKWMYVHQKYDRTIPIKSNVMHLYDFTEREIPRSLDSSYKLKFPIHISKCK